MDNHQNLGKMLQRLREKTGMSQSDLAKRLPFTASRISRLESGELNLDIEEAISIANAVGTPDAKSFATFLRRKWYISELPTFDHPSLETLWKIEQSLQQIDELKNDPELKNAFLKQVELCHQELLRAAGFLLSTEHSVAFMGSPGVGKTTAICAVTEGLRDWGEKDLGRQMVLQTGSGRTTICEVHIRSGREYAISIEPCSEEELHYYVTDFCDYLLGQIEKEENADPKDGSGISAEMERTLRNMTDLMVKRIKRPDGKSKREDPAIELVTRYPKKEELLVEILARLNVSKRRRTSIVYPQVSSIPAMKWLSKTFSEINFGHHPEFSVPKQIEVTIRTNVLSSDYLNIRLIDTRGIDEPSAPRRDLQACLDDERTVVILCSRFEDAPSAAVQALIERATEGGIRKTILNRSLLLILPKDGEEGAVLSELTGEPVMEADEGRQIRLDQVQTTTLANLGVRNLPIEFMNVRLREDCDHVRAFILSAIQRLRIQVAEQVDRLTQTVENLIRNKADEQVRLVFEQATKPIQTWLTNNRNILCEGHRVEQALLAEMESIRYPSSLRASVSRRGNWHNFDYWHGLGFGARRDAVSRTTEQITKLKGVIENILNDKDIEDAHSFLQNFLTNVEDATTAFFVDVQQLGETAFNEPLRSDHPYWQQCQNRWGMGSGYKLDIKNWTNKWFSDETRQARHEFLETEIQGRWTQMINNLIQHLESTSTHDCETSHIAQVEK